MQDAGLAQDLDAQVLFEQAIGMRKTFLMEEQCGYVHILE